MFIRAIFSVHVKLVKTFIQKKSHKHLFFLKYKRVLLSRKDIAKKSNFRISLIAKILEKILGVIKKLSLGLHKECQKEPACSTVHFLGEVGLNLAFCYFLLQFKNVMMETCMLLV